MVIIDNKIKESDGNISKPLLRFSFGVSLLLTIVDCFLSLMMGFILIYEFNDDVKKYNRDIAPQ
jgi:hypothetical protein